MQTKSTSAPCALYGRSATFSTFRPYLVSGSCWAASADPRHGAGFICSRDKRQFCSDYRVDVRQDGSVGTSCLGSQWAEGTAVVWEIS